VSWFGETRAGECWNDAPRSVCVATRHACLGKELNLWNAGGIRGHVILCSAGRPTTLEWMFHLLLSRLQHPFVGSLGNGMKVSLDKLEVGRCIKPDRIV